MKQPKRTFLIIIWEISLGHWQNLTRPLQKKMVETPGREKIRDYATIELTLPEVTGLSQRRKEKLLDRGRGSIKYVKLCTLKRKVPRRTRKSNTTATYVLLLCTTIGNRFLWKSWLIGIFFSRRQNLTYILIHEATDLMQETWIIERLGLMFVQILRESMASH